MIRKCLFPAAGYGTRFLPATKSMPKEILPIVNKPLIQYGVEEAVSADIHQIAIVTGRGKRAVEDHFDINYELEHQISGSDKESFLVDIRSLLDQCTFSYTRQIEMKRRLRFSAIIVCAGADLLCGIVVPDWSGIGKTGPGEI